MILGGKYDLDALQSAFQGEFSFIVHQDKTDPEHIETHYILSLYQIKFNLNITTKKLVLTVNNESVTFNGI